MENKLYICSVPFLSLDYQHVIDFSSLESQINFFKNKSIVSFNQKSSVDGERLEISIPYGMSELKLADYLMAYNSSEDKYYFYFINSKRYKTEKVTIIEIILDVWNTYLFNVTLLESYVDRCHVPRWNGDTPTKNTVDEGLPLGDYEQVEVENIYKYGYGMLISSSTPLGVIKEFEPPSQGGGGSTGELTTGIITKSGYRFIKGYEGFTPTGLYLNGESFRTVGYGSLENTNWYENHKPFPCSEQKASEIYWERIKDYFGLDLWNLIKSVGLDGTITTNQFNAMASVCYNCGFGGFSTWSTSPWQIIKNDPHNYNAIRNAWEKFAITSNGNILNGLLLRRKAECNIYCDNVYEMRSIGIYKDNGNGVGVLNGTLTDNNGHGYIPPSIPDDGFQTTFIEI